MPGPEPGEFIAQPPYVMYILVHAFLFSFISVFESICLAVFTSMFSSDLHLCSQWHLDYVYACFYMYVQTQIIALRNLYCNHQTIIRPVSLTRSWGAQSRRLLDTMDFGFHPYVDSPYTHIPYVSIYIYIYLFIYTYLFY